LAGIGYTANESVFEAGHGFFAAFGDEHSDASAVSGTLGNPYLFTSPGVSLKLYPCYNGVHRAIDAAREIVAAHPIDPASVESITCLLPPGRLQAVLYHHPTTGLEGKFSYEYVVAAAVLDGTVGIGSFSDEAVNRPQIQKLMSAVVLREDPACTGVGDEGRMKRMGTGGFMRVVVRTHDGEEYSADVARALGSPSRPLTWEHVEAKFGECARWAGVDDPTIVALTETLRGLPEAADVRSVVCGPQVAGVPHT
jgi:2-methylcitrate dehydratase PrpD